MHRRKTWDLCDLSLPDNRTLSFTNIDANSSRSNTGNKSSLASRCAVCQVRTAGWHDGLWVEVWLEHEVGTVLLLPAGWDQLAAGRRVRLLHGDQLAATMCFFKRDICCQNQADGAFRFNSLKCSEQVGRFPGTKTAICDFFYLCSIKVKLWLCFEMRKWISGTVI